MSVSPVKTASRMISNHVILIRDITHESILGRQLRQAQKMEAIGVLAGGIAHDFNNISTPIIAYTEIALYETAADDPLRKVLDRVLEAGHRAKELLQQILAFSRQPEQEKRPLGLATLTKEVLKFLRASLPAIIELRSNIGVRPPRDRILADPVQVHQVIINLCTNAAQAMQGKGGLLEVIRAEEKWDEDRTAVYHGTRPGAYLRLTVRDNGQGIPSELMDRIFEPYFTTGSQTGGTGMGLAVVHGIVKGHGGAIIPVSEPDKGTSFHVLFPRMERVPDSEIPEAAVIPRGTDRILFVDDEIQIVEMRKTVLQALGCEVLAFTSSKKAMEAFSAQPKEFDIVTTDMTMPNMTGMDLAREILRIRPDIPIILCTGYASESFGDMQVDARRIGIKELILKPLTIRHLAETIKRALKPTRNTCAG